MGLGGYLRRLREKMVGEPLSPRRIAAGWSLGMFVGCFIPFGLQLLVSIPAAAALRVSKVGATLGTFITNPLTIVFIYPVQTWVGCWLVGNPMSWDYLTDVCRRLGEVSLFKSEGWRTLGEIGSRILGGFFAGGLLLAFILTPLTYLLVHRLVVIHRKKHG